jgi:Saxitoxin biosynthesis operon protein SxtJ
MARSASAELRRFGLTVGGMFVLLGTLSRWRGHVWPPAVLIPLGVALIVPGLVAPGILGPVQRAWMGGARVIGEVNSRIILGIMYFLVFAPVGFVIRAFVRDPLDRKLDDGKPSNWIPRPRTAVEPARYEQQF